MRCGNIVSGGESLIQAVTHNYQKCFLPNAKALTNLIKNF